MIPCLPPAGFKGSINLNLTGSGGQSFGVFLAGGINAKLVGEANDYVGKGMAGGELVIVPPADAGFVAESASIVGNTCLYGATGGWCWCCGWGWCGVWAAGEACFLDLVCWIVRTQQLHLDLCSEHAASTAYGGFKTEDIKGCCRSALNMVVVICCDRVLVQAAACLSVAALASALLCATAALMLSWRARATTAAST